MKRLGSKWGASVRAVLCLLVLFVTSLDAIHNHGPLSTLGTKPLHSGEHCVLCMTAHLPLAVSTGTTAAAPVFSAALVLPLFRPQATREPLSGFWLYMRPPPVEL